MIRKLLLTLCFVFVFTVTASAQSELQYRSFNASVDTCDDASTVIIYQNNPSFTLGMYKCVAHAYVPLNLTAAGTGSVTSVGGTTPIVATPNPITGAGTISCPTCVTSTTGVTITASGITDFLPIWTGTTTLGNSSVQQETVNSFPSLSTPRSIRLTSGHFLGTGGSTGKLFGFQFYDENFANFQSLWAKDITLDDAATTFPACYVDGNKTLQCPSATSLNGDGRLLIGKSGLAPVFGNVTGSGVITVTNGPGTIDVSCPTCSTGGGTVTSVSGTTPISVATGTTTPVVSLDDTAVTPGSYTNTNLTVDQKGRITAASNGTSASPGGSNGNVQYNNSGTFGGMSGTTWTDASRSLAWLQSTLTASNPFISHTATWNNAGVTFNNFLSNVTDTASNPASKLFDFQVDGNSKLNLTKNGILTEQLTDNAIGPNIALKNVGATIQMNLSTGDVGGLGTSRITYTESGGFSLYDNTRMSLEINDAMNLRTKSGPFQFLSTTSLAVNDKFVRYINNGTEFFQIYPLGLTVLQGTFDFNQPAFNVTGTWNDASVTFQTIKTNMTDSASNAATKLVDLQVGSATKFSVRKDGLTTAQVYNTLTNCSDSAGAAACGSASAGSVVIDASATSVVVSTTAVTANSQIFLQFDSSLGTRLGITCNTTYAAPFVTARSAGTSFTFDVAAAPATNPACYSYHIVN